jgi:2-keto-4-pentenoate hydratase/2-oxohepta-3-ene-1,7-dioic acid hydratase in catechol pathway
MKWGRIDAGGAAVRVDVEAGELRAADGARYPLSGAKLLAPVVPGNFYAAGLNFRAHIDWANIDWANRHHGTSYKVPAQADIGYRSNNALVGSGADIVIPADSSGPVEFEGELVAVIGREGRNLSEAGALDCVAGYTLGNDVSERTWQRNDRTLWRAKNSDTFKPMGPFVVDGIDPMAQEIEVRINGRTVSRYDTRGMIFSVAHYISRMSRYLTLCAGDVIWFGCDGPTVPALQPGDLVEVMNDAIGVLANRVRKAA